MEHLAVIMDGNGRWAQKKGFPRSVGHREGVKVISKLIDMCMDKNIKILTLYVLSTENMHRPQEEVKGLFTLARSYFSKIDDFNKKNIRVLISGTKHNLPLDLIEKINEVQFSTANNNGFTLNMCFNYGGREEILHAVNSMLNMGIKKIDENSFRNYLYNNLPDPDLIIRTGGEKRLSNFLMWESAYSEFYFTDVLWPDFNQDDFDKAMIEYSHRKRNYGRV